MESPSSTKVQTPPFYVSEGYEISTLKNALFDITESSSILFKSTPKYLIIHAGTVVAWNTIFKFLADNEQFKFHSHLPKPLKPYSVFIRHLHPSTPVEDIQAYITDKGYAVIQLFFSSPSTLQIAPMIIDIFNGGIYVIGDFGKKEIEFFRQPISMCWPVYRVVVGKCMIDDFFIKDLWRAEPLWLEVLLPQRECLELKSPPTMNECPNS
ncbi:hypothetical protein QTP88_006084 [Uroleucon formosanum]